MPTITINMGITDGDDVDNDGDDGYDYDTVGDGDDDADFFQTLSMERILHRRRYVSVQPDEAAPAAYCVGPKVGPCVRLHIAQLPAESLGGSSIPTSSGT